MVGVANQQDISKDNSSLPFNDIYNSIRRVFNEIEPVKRESIDETTLEMGVAIADLLYEHQERIQNEFGENQHTKEIQNILCYFQDSTHYSDVSKHIKQNIDQIGEKEGADQQINPT